MRFAVKDESTRRAFLEELRANGIRHDVREELGYESFIGYVIEGTFEEIGETINRIEGEQKGMIFQGFTTFKEQFLHALEHLKEGKKIEDLLTEGYWIGDVLDQLMRNEAIDIDGEGCVKLKEGMDVTKLKLQFKIPYELVQEPEAIEKVAKQFAFIDLVPQYVVEIKEMELTKINAALNIAAKYFDERKVLRAYFALLSKSIVSREVLSILEQHEKIQKDVIIESFLTSSPIEISSEKGLLVINIAGKKAMENILRQLEKEGYIDIKAGKIRKVKGGAL
ncbi:hypothetical protein DRN43_06510 [Thermococci archaeon]|uniref:hypothetical protein n=1 Tax=Palaeococcus sp. (in: euryarchaeotes) TaxID=2820298 RepID=UPI000F224D72|nr:hypothetical protein [Palaeococcus sp. (in: euryarchaeotes)]MCD6559227.1 hypothetical protein [Palaeococcus sp. (in: euryarchaeotes)]RLF88152.1 MAG: hypothetical protein DRN43_06510 [Thermococci archaeon]